MQSLNSLSSLEIVIAQLAEKLNTTQAVISRIENGTVNIGIDFIDKLAKAFNKRVEINLV